MMTRFVYAAALALATGANAAASTDMLDSIRAKNKWNTYIFVSTSMPRSSLKELAYEASLSKATLVLNGWDPRKDLRSVQQLANEINKECCVKNPASWIVNPKLFSTFKVKSTPTFVIAQDGDLSEAGYGLVAGDMALANALKTFYQQSKYKPIRDQAQLVYNKSFRSNY